MNQDMSCFLCTIIKSVCNDSAGGKRRKIRDQSFVLCHVACLRGPVRLFSTSLMFFDIGQPWRMDLLRAFVFTPRNVGVRLFSFLSWNKKRSAAADTTQPAAEQAIRGARGTDFEVNLRIHDSPAALLDARNFSRSVNILARWAMSPKNRKMFILSKLLRRSGEDPFQLVCSLIYYDLLSFLTSRIEVCRWQTTAGQTHEHVDSELRLLQVRQYFPPCPFL